MPLSRYTTPGALKNGLVAAVLTLSSAVAVAPVAHAASADGAKAAVSEAVDRTTGALEDSSISDAEASSILELVDIDRVAQFSMGNHWQDMTSAQQDEFVEAFHTYAKNQLKEHLSGLSSSGVEITDVIPRGDDDAVVVTQVSSPDSDVPQKISWRVINTDGWKLVDIQAQDVWFAIEQRAQFDAILDKNGGDFDALIEQIS